MARASTRKKATVNYSEAETEVEVEVKVKVETNGAVGKTRAKAKRVKRKADAEDEAAPVQEPETAPKKRKTKKEKEEEAMPLAARSAITALKKAMYIGAHVSAAGGVHNSVTNAVHIGANSFALFLKSQRKWECPPLAAEARDLFASHCKDHSYSAGEHALPHGSYLVNLAQAEPDKAAQAYNHFVDDLSRCEELGIRLYNFHPGSTGGDTKEAACGRIAAQLNKAHKATKSVVTVLENMAGSGNVVGSTWEDLRDIIALVEDKERVGVCIDTCHAFAAGHDLRSPEAFKRTFDSFNEIVGARSVNDSKAPLGSNRDLHANIGTGFLGLRAFHNVMNSDAFCGMPMVLETPIDRKDEKTGKMIEDKQVWADEIKLLESLIGMDPDGSEFRKLEEELHARGASERKRIQEQVDKKAEKDAKKAERDAKKGTRKKKQEDDD
ncbi:DNA-like protein [Hapsidospora chrysogenum ATCC 11550]|uniref:Apurinic-apyrimidinic endonuclease 1 n=1 Tax=Hapsidospora chrysogenum (strain ATCC 11550 / CBS 779.69 / DSM 880 / IAM 14645 / JCM 23072 / IMI 49137) TaxID=857340 RepID=A0A086SZY5_HAPC1|nr:DNA-like protein [Hapsidospora chrysogenum ATCC 11550]